MTTYSEEIEKLFKRQRQRLNAMERHKAFYPLISELDKLKHAWCSFSQYQDRFEITIYCSEKADKTYPEYIRENILSNSWLEEAEEPQQRKSSGEYLYFFRLKAPTFGNGSRPELYVKVDYTNLCRRVVTGREYYETSEYICD